MPKKKNKNVVLQTEQSKRFIEKAKELEAAGELNLTGATRKFEKVVKAIAPKTATPKRKTRT